MGDFLLRTPLNSTAVGGDYSQESMRTETEDLRKRSNVHAGMRMSRGQNEEMEAEIETAVENTESVAEKRNEGTKGHEKEKMKTTVGVKVVKSASGKSSKAKEAAGPADNGTAVLEANARSGDDIARIHTGKEELNGGKGDVSRESVTRKTLTETELTENKGEEDYKRKEGAGMAISGGDTAEATLAKVRSEDGEEPDGEMLRGKKVGEKKKHCTVEVGKEDGCSSGGVTAGEEKTGGVFGVNGGVGADGGTSGAAGKIQEKEGKKEKKKLSVGEMFLKELTVIVWWEGGVQKLSVLDMLVGVQELCGVIMGCREKGGGGFEVTMKERGGMESLLEGVRVRGVLVEARGLLKNEVTVSFMNIPVYIEDDEILLKLMNWGVEPASHIIRRRVPGTRIADGTRHLRVVFKGDVHSLPYSTKFEVAGGEEYFNVKHDGQRQVCRNCLKPGHIFRECPDVVCFRCREGGHLARNCEVGRGRREVEEVQAPQREKGEEVMEEQAPHLPTENANAGVKEVQGMEEVVCMGEEKDGEGEGRKEKEEVSGVGKREVLKRPSEGQTSGSGEEGRGEDEGGEEGAVKMSKTARKKKKRLLTKMGKEKEKEEEEGRRRKEMEREAEEGMEEGGGERVGEKGTVVGGIGIGVSVGEEKEEGGGGSRDPEDDTRSRSESPLGQNRSRSSRCGLRSGVAGEKGGGK